MTDSTHEDDNKLDRVDAFEHVAGAIIAGGVGVAMVAAPQMSAEIQAAINVMIPTLSLAAGHGLNAILGPRRESFGRGFLKAFNDQPEVATAKVEEQQNNPDHHDRMYKAFRQMLDAADPSVVETLGFLAGQYTFANRRADGYFRSLGRLLCDLEEGDLADLKTLLRGVDECTGDGELTEAGVPEVGVRIAQQQGEAREFLQAQIGKDKFRSLGPVRAARRVFFLLKREGLGSGIGGGFLRPWNVLQSNEGTIMMNFITSKKMLRTIDPRPTE